MTPARAAVASETWWKSLLSRPEPYGTLICLLGLIAGWQAGDGAIGGWPVATIAYTVSYLAGGWFTTVSALAALRHGLVEIDLLMVLAALGAAYVGAPLEGAVLLFLFSLSNVLQDFAIERSRNAVRGLMDLRPRTALVRRGGETLEVGVEQLQVGDRVVIRPGERIPTDGVILEGKGTLDQSSMTGESVPVEASPGSRVLGGTVCMVGGFEMEVASRPDDSVLSRMVALVQEAQDNKGKSQRFLEKAEQGYAVFVILFTALVAVVPLIWGQPWEETFYRAMTVMVVMSPCALVISVPATVLSAIGGAARMGILFKGGVHLERTATLESFALDKTGTLTLGMPSVRQVQPWHGDSPRELLRLAAAVSERSEHPIARAFVRRAQEDGLVLPPATDFRVFVGLGTEAVVSGRRITVGNMRKLVGDGGCGDIIAHSAAVDAAAQLGQTPVGVAERQGDGTVRVLGMITVADTIRPEAREAMAALRDCGIRRLVMITGDDRRVANAVAREIGLDEVHAELLPEDKVKVVKSLGEQGPVAMVGDGVNDAPCLAAATVGIAMGKGGTDIALETADVVLMGNRLEHLARAVRISRQARRVIFQNLVFAGGVMLLLTVSTLIGHVPLTLGVAGHEGSTIVVCLNGLRLLWVSKYA